MEVLVTGDRDWSHRLMLYAVLDGILATNPGMALIEGECRGADIMSRKWAESRGVPYIPYPADWDKYNKGAGPVRNRQMVNEQDIDLAIAFHDNLNDSRGTADMVSVLKEHDIPTYHMEKLC